MPTFSTPHLEEFYNHAHDGATGRFSARAASGRTVTAVPSKAGKADFLQHTGVPRLAVTYRQNGERLSGGARSKAGGGPVTGAKLPLRNATTGRINPLPVRHAFKQGLSEIISKRKEDSKRTTLTSGKVRTVGTYKGRKIKHISSTGGADRAGFREGG